MPDAPSLLMSCALCLRLHVPLDPELSNPVCPRCGLAPGRGLPAPRGAPGRPPGD